MTIAIDARIIRTSTGRYVERLLHYLQQIDPENQYVVLLKAKDFDGWNPTAPNFSKAIADYDEFTFAEQLGFLRFLYRQRYDLVHFTSQHMPVLYRRPYVVTLHDLTLLDFVNRRPASLLIMFYKHTVKPAVFKVAIRRFAKGARYVITPTNYVRERLIQRVGAHPNRVITTYEAADPMSASPVPVPALINESFILAVGNAPPYKNLQGLVDAFSRIDRPELKLVLAGWGNGGVFYRQLQDYIEHQGIKNVIITGFVPDEQLAWLYTHAKAYVFPSLSEGFGLPGLEAMHYGVPVVASNNTCLPEVYDGAAHYFDPRDPKDMARRIEEVLDDEALRQQLTEAGHRRLGFFSWEKMARETQDIYKRALSGK